MVKLGAAPKEKTESHFIFIEAPMDYVAPEVIIWGEGQWWPQNCPSKFFREGPGDIRVGTKYKLRVGSKTWKVTVSKIDPKRFIERKFENGPLKGAREIVSMDWRYNGTRVQYELCYVPRGLLWKLIWGLFYRPRHDKNIKMILQAMKEDIEQRLFKKQEDEWEKH